MPSHQAASSAWYFRSASRVGRPRERQGSFSFITLTSFSVSSGGNPGNTGNPIWLGIDYRGREVSGVSGVSAAGYGLRKRGLTVQRAGGRPPCFPLLVSVLWT